LQEVTLLNGFNRGENLKTNQEIETFMAYGETRQAEGDGF
jgi:hypothetical protein